MTYQPKVIVPENLKDKVLVGFNSLIYQKMNDTVFFNVAFELTFKVACDELLGSIFSFSLPYPFNPNTYSIPQNVGSSCNLYLPEQHMTWGPSILSLKSKQDQFDFFDVFLSNCQSYEPIPYTANVQFFYETI